MKRFFQKVDNQLNICYQGHWYFVKKEEDENLYNSVLKKLSKKPLTDTIFEDALSSMGLFKAQSNKDLRIDKGNIFINEVKAPKIFTEIINNSLSNDVSVDYLIKFFKNLVFDTNYKEDLETRKKVKNLFNSQAYCPDKRSQVVFMDKVNEYKELPFYSYANLPHAIKSIFIKESSIEEICSTYFGGDGKNLQKYILNELLDEESKSIDCSILMYGTIFKDILSSNNFKKVYENKSIDSLFKNTNSNVNFHLLNKVFSHFTEKKILSFIKKGFVVDDVILILQKYPIVATVHDLSNNKFLNITELKEFLKREAFKIEAGENFPLVEESHFPQLEEIKSKYFDEIEMTCIIPQDYYELISWSNTMGNCIGQGTSYASKASKGKTLLIGFSKVKKFKDYTPENIQYNIEIKNGVIVQFESKKTRSQGVSLPDRKFIKKLLHKHGLIKANTK